MKNRKESWKYWLRRPPVVVPVTVVLTISVLAFLVCRTYAFIALAAYMGNQRAVGFMVEKAQAEKNDKNLFYWIGHFSDNPDDYPPDMMSPEDRKIINDLKRMREGL